MTESVTIVGASHAGVQVAASLRELGFAGAIRLVHGEGALPYQRPPLSKTFLADGMAPEAIVLRSPEWFAAKGIELLRGARVRAVDVDARRLEIEAAVDCPGPAAVPESLSFDRLVLATGAAARTLPVPGATLEGVLTLRTLADAAALRRRLSAATSVAIIGAGFIGLEVAATARKLGKAVTVLEAEGRVLARLFPQEMSDFLLARHSSAGSVFLFDARVTEIGGTGQGSLKRVTLADGRALEAELVVIGIGAAASDELARRAGLACGNGIAIDATCRTADPAIFACGDCAVWPTPYADGPGRNESVQTAVDQAKTAAAAIAGAPCPAQVAPWFWSDQLDLKLQMVGTELEADEVVCRGSMDEGKFSLLYFRGEELTRVDSINSPADHIAARRLVSERARLSKAAAADPATRLKDLG